MVCKIMRKKQIKKGGEKELSKNLLYFFEPQIPVFAKNLCFHGEHKPNKNITTKYREFFKKLTIIAMIIFMITSFIECML